MSVSHQKPKWIFFVLAILAVSFLATSWPLEQPENISLSDLMDSIYRSRLRLVKPPLVFDARSGEFAFIAFGDSRSSGQELKQDELSEPLEDIDSGDSWESSGVIQMCKCDDPDKVSFYTYRIELLNQVSSLLKNYDQKAPPLYPGFAIFSGDMVWQGGQQACWEPIRQIFDENVRGDVQCPARLFSAIGNHELWQGEGGAPPLDLFFQTYPCQQSWLFFQRPISRNKTKLHYFAFFVKDSVFITLCSGGYWKSEDLATQDTLWNCIQADFEIQMKWMVSVIDYGIRTKGLKNVFVQYHKPSFSEFKHPPLASENDPLDVLKKYADSLNMFVFNGHNHTTELYRTEGITVLVAGGGGAPQPPSCPDCSHPKQQPEELFWSALGYEQGDRSKRVNYFVVKVSGDGIKLEEHCLTNRHGDFEFEPGVTITQSDIDPPSDKYACTLTP